MSVNASVDEPTIPPRLQRPLAALWISLGLHAALIALVQVAPPAATRQGEMVIEARLVSSHTAAPAPMPLPAAPAEASDAPVQPTPRLAPSETAEALPVAQPPTAHPAENTPAPQPAAAPAAVVPSPVTAEAPAVSPAPAVAITSAVDLTYYTVRDLDVQPRALREVVPEYPYDADRQRLSGTVHVQLKLEADGRVSEAEVVSATPPGRFEDSALRAFRAARFAPAQKNGRPVRAQVVITVVYDWEGRRR